MAPPNVPNPLAPEQTPSEAHRERQLVGVLVVAGLVVAIIAAANIFL